MTAPISPELLKILNTLSPTQLAWLSGYSWAQSQQQPHNNNNKPATATEATAETTRSITILSASQTGNARKIAEQLLLKLETAGINSRLIATGDYKSKNINQEDIILLITSTQGEGEAPEEAIPLYTLLFSKKAPDLKNLHFAVLALGDSSYPDFCQAGKDFDTQLAKLGAKRLIPRVDCDIDYTSTANAWQDEIIGILTKLTPPTHQNNTNRNETEIPRTQPFNRDNPFTATLSSRQKITSRHANKDIEHIEIDLTDSGIYYTPGDALGVYYQNNPELIEEILHHTQVDPQANVRLTNGSEVSITIALRDYLDITQNTPALIQSYAELTNITELQNIAADSQATQNYINQTPPIGMLAAYPHPLTAQNLHDLWRPMTPRMYSIASSQAEVAEEVHLTVGVVRFEHHQHTYTGGASGFLGTQLQEGGNVRIFVEENNQFRLPEDGNTPIIMIGAGTGIAPFRAFMQQREANGDQGANWLIFGNQKFTDDFLYQTEWLNYRKNGLLNQYDLAWSRQNNEKVYVQHKLHQRAADIWNWLNQGAHIYVCGDANKMARDVEQALIDIIIQQGNKNHDEAREYLTELREEKRYQRDVY